ncbi:MAG: replicative DNA helicase [Nitrospirae bacterium]|nr:MAG: replicative DNA helicase [Nitrospirota bacterium]
MNKSSITPLLNRIPPQNIEAEKSVIASILIENETLSKAIEILTPEDFYKTSHKIIFRSMIDLYERNEPIDLITLTDYMSNKGMLESVGGATYLSEIISEVPTAANISYYCKIVKEKSILRTLIHTATEITTMCYEGIYDNEELLDIAEQKIFAVTENRIKPSFFKIGDVLKTTMEHIDKLHDRKKLITGIPSGFIDLDNNTAGFQPGDLIILGARPSMGKTAFALNIAQYVSIVEKIPVAIFSLEMSKEQIVLRMLCSEAEIDSKRVRSGCVSQEEFSRIQNATGRLHHADIFIDDSNNNVLEIRAKSRRLKSEHGLGLIIVDYLQLMESVRKGTESREREIAEISRSLKNLAKELAVPIIALSQLNRAVEARVDKHPTLADLRESGAIEQDADVILFLYRDEYYYPEKTDNKGIAELEIAKQRNGPTNRIKLTFIREYTTFKNYTERSVYID